jgi:hypothetical protein
MNCSGDLMASIVNVTNLSFINPNTTLNFSFSQFLSHPTDQPLFPINITSYSNGDSIDTCIAYIASLTPSTMTNISVKYTPPMLAMLVNNNYTLNINFTINDPIS